MEVSPPSHRHASDAKVYRPNRYRRCKMEQHGSYLDVIIGRYGVRRRIRNRALKCEAPQLVVANPAMPPLVALQWLRRVVLPAVIAMGTLRREYF